MQRKTRILIVFGGPSTVSAVKHEGDYWGGGDLHKHASLLPLPLFIIHEIRVASAHWFQDVIADNCSSPSDLEAAV